MRRTIITAALILTFTATAGAQNLANKAELSLGIGFPIVVERPGASRPSPPVISFPFRVGYFITNGFEIEAEGVLSLFDSGWFDVDASMTGSFNALYNFSLGSRRERLRPFLLAGIGQAEFRNHYIVAVDRTAISYGVSVYHTAINYGAGFKALTGRHTAFRLEYRLQCPTGSGQNIPSVQMGVSFFM